MKNINDFFVEMPFNIQGSAGGNFTDVHAGESFHARELNICTLPAGSCPGFSRQFRNVFHPIPLDDWNAFFAQPGFVTRISFHHQDTVLSYFFAEGK